MQLDKLACSSISLHAVTWPYMKFHELACSFLSLHAVPFLVWAAHKNFAVLVFFRKQEDKSRNLIKSELHRKKDRQRNLLPAKTGILLLVLVFFSTLAYSVSYGLNLDVYTRSFYLALVNDLFPCFISPMVVLFEAPVIRRRINKTFLMYQSHLHEKVRLLMEGQNW